MFILSTVIMIALTADSLVFGIHVMNCEENSLISSGVGARMTNLSFNPLTTFTMCVRLQFQKLNPVTLFARISDPGKRPPLELQLEVDKFRVVVAGEYKYAILRNWLQPFTWYFLCVTSWSRNQSKYIDIYVDGNFIVSHEIGLKLKSVGKDLTLGFLDPNVAIGYVFIGNLTQFNIWSTILSQETITKSATCNEIGQGDVISWENSDWIIQKAKMYNHSLESFCPPKQDVITKVLPQRSFLEAVQTCEGIGGVLYTPAGGVDDFNILRDLNLEIEVQNDFGFWTSLHDQTEEGSWVHHTNKKNLVNISWAPDEPNGLTFENCATFSSKGLADKNCIEKRHSLCILPTMSTWNLRGSCETLVYKMNFILELSNETWVFRGYGDYLIYQNNSTWFWKDLSSNQVVAFINNPEMGNPFGRRHWQTLKSFCDQVSDQRLFVLSSCSNSEFSCDDGTCIPFLKRCDQQYDCSDNSDEVNCQLYSFPKDYRYTVTPRSSLRESHLSVVTNVLLESINIQTNEMILKIAFNLTMAWNESRATYYNLKENFYLNQIEIQNSIWSPSVSFVNTMSHSVTKVDQKLLTFVQRKQISKQEDFSYPQRMMVYSGALNPIVSHRKYSESFTCDFDLLLYPFDSQKCSLVFRMRSGSSVVIQFDRLQTYVEYKGVKDLMEYQVLDLSHEISIVNGFSTMKIVITLKRLQGYAFINIYIPSSTMLTIAFLTLYFKMDNFEARIMAALTALLVMATMFNQVAASLPRTSYFKMVDIWLLFCIFTTFIIIIFHILVDLNQHFEMRNKKNMKSKLGFKEEDQIRPNMMKKFVSHRISSFMKSPSNLQSIGRVMTTSIIIIFNLVYWGTIYYA